MWQKNLVVKDFMVIKKSRTLHWNNWREVLLSLRGQNVELTVMETFWS